MSVKGVFFMSRKKVRRKTEYKSYLKPFLLFFTLTIILFLIFSVIGYVSDVNVERIYIISLSFICTLSFAIGFISGYRKRKNGMFYGILSALPINVLFIIASLIINKLHFDLNIFYTLFTGLLASATGGIISVNIRLK